MNRETAATSLPTHDRALTDRVLSTLADTPSPRLRQVLSGLVSHLHAFASDVQLTEQEWTAGVEFVTRLGQISDDERQETILLSDVLGLSMLVIGINHPPVEGVTDSTVFGPFFVAGSPAVELGEDLSGGARGVPCDYRGTITSRRGEAVPGARIEVWHSDEDGNYDVQYEDLEHPQGRGHLFADDAGRYRFRSVLPEPYPIPTDGPVGDLLRATVRSPMRPAHVHFLISAPGYRDLITHVFREADPYLGSDAVFGERESLVRSFIEPAGAGERYAMSYNFVLDDAAAPAAG